MTRSKVVVSVLSLAAASVASAQPFNVEFGGASGEGGQVICVRQPCPPVARSVPPGAPPFLVRDMMLQGLNDTCTSAAPVGPAGMRIETELVALSLQSCTPIEITTPRPDRCVIQFFDVAVNFEDIFCSIRTDRGLRLVHLPSAQIPWPAAAEDLARRVRDQLVLDLPDVTDVCYQLAGDRLEVYFDPAYSIGPSGVGIGGLPRCGVTAYAGDEAPTCMADARFSPAHNGNDAIMMIRVKAGDDPAPAMRTWHVPPMASPDQVASSLIGVMNATGALALDAPGPGHVWIRDCDATEPIEVFTMNAALERCTLATRGAEGGMAGFAGHFDPFDALTLQPAVFTAGIVTDVGELSARVSAQELNFQTDGPIICQALFQRLAPRAPQYGAQINYAGDRLEIYFDPAYTVTQGGIIFGTTSQSQGTSGMLLPPAPQNPCPGDFNNSGGVPDDADVAAFFAAWGMGDPSADVNGSGGVPDDADVAYFFQRWSAGC